MEELDEQFYVHVGRTKDYRYLTISANSKTSSEVCLTIDVYSGWETAEWQVYTSQSSEQTPSFGQITMCRYTFWMQTIHGIRARHVYSRVHMGVSILLSIIEATCTS